MNYDTPNPIIEFKQPLQVEHFTLATVAGRDLIAEQVESDIDHWCKVAYDDPFRKHLGASEIGHACAAFLWFKFRWMFREEFDGRMLRLFRRGHSEEPKLIGWLEYIGIRVHNIDPNTGEQYRFSMYGGHFGGSGDGFAILPERYGPVANERLLLELKTNKDYGRVDFDKLRNLGVIKYIPKHYSQMCTYGKQFKVQYALYCAINKNTDEIHLEIIWLDWTLAEDYESKAEFIILSNQRPMRLSENPSYYECKYCPALSICHFKAPTLKNCRSCRNATPIDNGWHCNLYNSPIPEDFIIKGCDNWLALHQGM